MLYVVGKVVGTQLAARLFALLVLAANAFILPRFVLTLTGSRNRMLIASLFMWPMVHNWFVSMGMLDFALSVPLSLGLLLAVDRHRRSPSFVNAGLITLVGAATWYAHVFPLLVVSLLVGIEAMRGSSWKERFTSLRVMVVPLLPVTALVAVSLFAHLRDNVGPMSAFVHHHVMVAPWELAYNLWAEWFWGFTKLSITSIVPCLLLAYYGFGRRRESPTFFSPVAVVALGLLFCLAPYRITNWYHVNSRLIPYLWFALLLRVPVAPGRPPREFAPPAHNKYGGGRSSGGAKAHSTMLRRSATAGPRNPRPAGQWNTPPRGIEIPRADDWVNRPG